MRRQYNVAQLVYNNIYPNPTSNDPADFSQHLIRHLITEVRIETHRFYGGLETIEAKYPGLNYVHGPHRKRLSQFVHHARLFRAFDELGLTAFEIGELCKWEGTLWARQRYERDEGVRVLDTTGNEIRSGIDEPPLRVGASCRASGGAAGAAGARKRNAAGHIKVKTDIEVAVEVEDRRRSASRQDRRRMLLLRRREQSPSSSSSSPRASPPASPSASTPLLPSPPANHRRGPSAPEAEAAVTAADDDAAPPATPPPADAEACDDGDSSSTDNGGASSEASPGPPSSNTSVAAADDTYMKDVAEAGDGRWPPTGAVPSPPEVQR